MITSIILQFIVILLIVALVLLQSSSGDGFSSFTSGYNTVFSTKGTTNFLSKMTWICIMIFFLNTILLSKFYGSTKTKSIIEKIEEDKFEQILENKHIQNNTKKNDIQNNIENDIKNDIENNIKNNIENDNNIGINTASND